MRVRGIQEFFKGVPACFIGVSTNGIAGISGTFRKHYGVFRNVSKGFKGDS